MKKNLIFVVSSVLLLVTTAIIYVPKFSRQGLTGIELTFLSNFVAGILLLLDSLYGILKKLYIPQSFHLITGSILLCVLLISLLCIGEANFSGVFMFLHVINPLLYAVLVILFTYQRPIKLSFVFIGTLVLTMLYFIYVILYGLYSGDWLYSVINIREKGIGNVVLFYVAAVSCVLLLECLFYKTSKAVSKR